MFKLESALGIGQEVSHIRVPKARDSLFRLPRPFIEADNSQSVTVEVVLSFACALPCALPQCLCLHMAESCNVLYTVGPEASIPVIPLPLFMVPKSLRGSTSAS